MRIYQVGGSVRDLLLGQSPKDIDYVVVGSDQETMLKLGYSQAGESFPVFKCKEGHEYVLARRESKTNKGHTGFSFETKGVLLIEDLLRRDLTINSIALTPEGDILDPFGGVKDLHDKIFRHTSEAFSEDPLRVFRVARFAARFPEFSIAPETMELMKEMTKSEDFKTLSNQRIFSEMESALETQRPSRFFEVLKEAGGLSEYFPELLELDKVPQRADYHPEGDCWIHTMIVLDQAAGITDSVKVRFAALVHDLGKGITPEEILPAHHNHEEAGIPLVEEFCKRLRVPTEWKETALIVTSQHLKVHQLKKLKPSTIIRMFYDIGAYRSPGIVKELAQACEADAMGKYKNESDSKSLLEEYFTVTTGISFKDCRPGLKGEAIANEIRQLRVLALKSYIDDRNKNQIFIIK